MGIGFGNASYDLVELMPVIRFLSLIDSLSIELVSKGIVELLNQSILARPKSTEEKEMREQEIMDTIWQLSFRRENHGEIKKYFEERAKEMSVKAPNPRVVKAAQGILWELQDKQTMTKGTIDSKKYDIMISYNWGVQKRILVMKEMLEKKGFKIWLDLDQMKGSTIEAMASAVENSSVIFICMSQNYKNSANCRAEAEYAFRLKKPIIPLMCERNYNPDGWLGFVLGSKLWYEVIDENSLNDGMDKIRKDVVGHLGNEPSTPTLIRRESSRNVSDGPSYLTWNSKQVGEWLVKHNLQEYVETFQRERVNGRTLGQLKHLSERSQGLQIYFRILVHRFKLGPIGDMLEFDQLLRDLEN